MGLPSQQIGWNTESKLLYEIGKQLSRLIQLTRPRVIYLSESDLLSLATNSGLTIGQLYYDNDRDWLLIADSTSVLKPISGTLKIMNGDSLPSNIQPDILLIDTGVVESADYSLSSGTPMPLTIPIGYYPILYQITGTYSSDIVILDPDDNIIGSTVNDKAVAHIMTAANDIPATYFEGYNLRLTCGYVEGTNFRAIIEFHRSAL